MGTAEASTLWAEDPASLTNSLLERAHIQELRRRLSFGHLGSSTTAIATDARVHSDQRVIVCFNRIRAAERYERRGLDYACAADNRDIDRPVLARGKRIQRTPQSS